MSDVEWMMSTLTLSTDMHPDDFAMLYILSTDSLVDQLLDSGVKHEEIRFTEEQYIDIETYDKFYKITGYGPRPYQTKETNEPTAD